jgi:hypothetical protein
MVKVGSGIGKTTARIERHAREATFTNFADRAEKLGKFPGTHTLGKEFQTVQPRD